jgi:uncharacterized protein
MNFEGASQFILHKLENELPDILTYHNLAHTKEVYEAATRIGKEENITDEELQLLQIAALYHDSGWTFSDTEHEMMSCEIVMKYLPDYGFTNEQIEVVCKLIMATRLPWSPEDHLQKIIVDADLDYLGTNRFFPRAEDLRQELISLGRLAADTNWNKLQVKFLETHNYYTPSAIKSRGQKKTENLELLKKSL